MDENDEFGLFVWNMLKGLHDISQNVIQSRKYSRYFFSKKLGNKDGEGSSIISQHEGKKVYDETLFSKARPHNRLLEFKGDIKS